jgi:hypothetical protein
MQVVDYNYQMPSANCITHQEILLLSRHMYTREIVFYLLIAPIAHAHHTTASCKKN